MINRAVAWLVILAIAIIVGLPLDHTTLFWVGVLSIWVIL